MRRQYAPVIDLVRCMAAMVVAFFHLGTQWPSMHNKQVLSIVAGYPNYSHFDGLFFFGFVGVQVFFVISGYVISVSSIGRDPRSFLIGRALRLLPILWIAATIGAVIQIAKPGILLLWLRTMVIFPVSPWVDDVIWTLVVEVMFYGTVWLLLMFVNDVRSALIRLAYILTVVSLVYLLSELFIGKFSNWLPTLLLLRHGSYFALGIFIWAGLRPIAILSVAACVVEIVLATAGRNISALVPHSPVVPIIFWLMSLVIIWWGSQNLRASVQPWIRTAGLMTYPIYLIHQTVGGLAIYAASRMFPADIALVVGLAFMLFVSWLIVKFIEPEIRPALRAVLERLPMPVKAHD